MVYKIFIENKKIELPNGYTLEERIEYCKELISKYEEYFTYEITTSKITSSSACEKVKLRLDILGQYIYDASTEGRDDTVITPCRRRRNRNREVIFSEIERDTNE